MAEDGSGGATSTPAESTQPAGRAGGVRSLLGPGCPAVALLGAAIAGVMAWRQSYVEAVILGVTGAALSGRWRLGVALVLVAMAVVWRAAEERAGLTPDELGPYVGWATVAADPRPAFGATRVVLQIEGERFELWTHRRSDRLRVDGWQQGDVVWIEGTRGGLDAERAERVAWQHVVGDFVADVLGDRSDGRRLDVASNRVRTLIDQATSEMAADEAALARGLIIGDDGEQPPEMTERFRGSGLSHLTAVSGQNVALFLAVASPMLRRARPAPRLLATLALIGWFVVLTRAEPSVLRAGTMAGLAAAAFTLGGEREPPRLLAVAVIILLLVDPLLVESVGFWLSVGATAGVTILGPPLRRRLDWLRWLATPLAMTLAAQIGVAAPSLLVFGRLSFSGTVANLVAIPVAGLVMLYGLPACVVAGLVAPLRPVLMLPVALGVRWVDAVAAIAAGAEPAAPWSALCWLALALMIGAACCVRRGDDDHDELLQQ